MGIFYTPQKLMNSVTKVKNIFPEKGRIVKPGEMDDMLKQLIMIVVGLNPKNVIKFGEGRTSAEISSLAGYVCTNYLKVDCKNIYTLLFNYASSEDFATIVKIWEQYYHLPEPKEFIQSVFYNRKGFVETYIEENSMASSAFQWIMTNYSNSDDLLRSIISSCGNVHNMEEYEHKLKNIGIIENTKLYNDCINSFYLYCSATGYKEDEKLKSAYSGFNNAKKIQMIANMLNVLEVKEMDKFLGLYKRVKESREVQSFAKMMDEELSARGLISKFNMWFSRAMILTMDDKRGDDDYNTGKDVYRAKFWIKYSDAATSVSELNFSSYSNGIRDTVMIFDFGDYVATEFPGKAGGRSYIIEKSLFATSIKRDFDFRLKYVVGRSTKTDFKSMMNSLGTKGVVERMAHNNGYDYWWSDFAYYLGAHGIYKNRIVDV